MGGGSAGLVGSINPTLNLNPLGYSSAGNPVSSNGSATGAINVLTGGLLGGLTLGSSGIIMLALVAVVGVVFLIKGV